MKEKDPYFLFRTKDIHSKWFIGNFEFPDDDSFSIQINIVLIRSHKKKLPFKEGYYKRFVNTATSFYYIAYSFSDTYDLSFRIIRFPISDDSYECIVINLPADEFPLEQIKLLIPYPIEHWGVFPQSKIYERIE